MKRFSMQISLLALLTIPAIFAFGWWARDRSYGHAIGRLERSIAKLNVQRRNDLLIDELRGYWRETSRFRRGVLIDYGDVAGRPVEVSWLLDPQGGSHRRVDASEMDVLNLGNFTVDTTKDPVWIDFRSRGGGRPFVCFGIVRVRHGYTNFGSATIALSQPSWHGDPQRPTSFESTRQNQVSVYRLEREY
jgi:hypothetical protein